MPFTMKENEPERVLFSGIMSRSVLLVVASLLFAPAHILISYKNAKYYMNFEVYGENANE